MSLAVCHPEEKNHSKGLCKLCYMRDYHKFHYNKNKDAYKSYRKSYYQTNKEKCLAQSRSWYEVNKDKVSKDTRINRLRVVYNITLEEFNQLCESQDHRCGICGKHKDDLKINLCIDHCHRTGKIRGVLCSACNRALGQLGDTKESVQKALDYLK